MKRPYRTRASRRKQSTKLRNTKPTTMTARKAIRAIGRAPLHVLVWLLAEPMIWLPLGALLLTRFDFPSRVPFAGP